MTIKTIQYTERMVGAGHPVYSDTLNRLTLVGHNTDGSHKGYVEASQYNTTPSSNDGLQNALLVVPTTTQIVVTSVQSVVGGTTISHPICVKPGGSIYVPSGVLTLNGPFEAGLYTCFSGGGTISFGSGSVTEVYPQWWGAVGDGVHDDANAVNFAISTGGTVFFSVGTYLVGSPLTIATKGQIIKGSGRARTTIKPSGSFSLSSNGVFIFASGEEGPQIRDLRIDFTQPDTTIRGSLTAWPPAIYAVNTPRFMINNCQITNAMTGIKMTGNSGGAIIDTLELSAYNIGIEIDGSLDSVYIQRLHLWNFGMTTNQASIFQDSSTIGIKCGRMDDLHLSDSLFICGGKQIYFWRPVSGTSVFGNITNCGFDTYGKIVMEDGTISVTGSQFTAANSTQSFIGISGGYLRVTNCEFSGTSNGYSSPLITVDDTAAGTVGTYFELNNSIFRLSGDATFIQSTATSPERSTIIVNANQFVVTPSISRVLPMLDINAGSRVTITGNRVTDLGTGSGTFVDIVEDESHIVTDNMFFSWGLVLPATVVSARISNNSFVGASDYVNNYAVGTPLVKYFTGLLDGSGNITVAHGVSNLYRTAINAQGYYKGASGELKVLTFNYIDGTNASFTGGVAGRPYRIAVTYSGTSQTPW